MKYHKVFIGIGSNVGDRLQNIKKAIELINENQECKVVKTSSIYESKAFGVKDQNDFLNSVICIDTNLDPVYLLEFLKNIESKIGRTKTEKWGPREIDLDILLFGDLIFSENDLSIPHKGIQERDFVMIPLTEMEPEIVHPVLKAKVKDLIQKADKNIIGHLSKETK